jgi:DNA polymerase-3 subunit gamma/tau
MTYQVLARKWRPRAFEALVGQQHVVTALANALDSGRLHHAYLFTGTRGVGKTTLARILAKALNCETGITSKPCGKCRACTEIDAGRFVDLLEVDAATNTKVDEMRELLDTAQYMPASGRFKVYIIDEVHMLTRHAFNSMLKTLEEPPEHVKFILATTDPQRLPVTVLSRCLQFNLKPLPPGMIAAHLKRVLETEGVAFEEGALALIAKAAAGSVRDSLSLLDQAIAHGAGRVTAVQVAEMLGTVGADLVWPLLERIAAGDGRGAIEECERIGARSMSFDSALEDLASLLHRVALAQAGVEPAADEPDRDAVLSMAAKLDRPRVQVMYQVALLGRRDLPLAPDELAGFTMTVLRMLSFSDPGTAAKNVPGVTVQAPAKPAAATPTADAPKFDGNWAEFVSRLELNGMAGLLARYGELASFENNHLELIVPESQKAYTDRSYQEKLRAVLVPIFGAGFRLSVRAGVANGSSLAAARAKEDEQRQASAVSAIEQDPFVRDLVRDFGAEVVPASIRPAGGGNGQSS